MLAAWALADRRLGVRALGALLLAAASLLAWSLLAIGAWAALLAWRREGCGRWWCSRCSARRRSSRSTACSPPATGFDPIGTLRATEQVYRFGIADQRPYWFWLTGLAVGVPADARAAGRLAGARRARARARTPRSRSSPCSRSRRWPGSPRPRWSGSGCRSRRSPASPRRPCCASATLRPVLALLARPGARLGAAVEHRLVTHAAGRRYSTMSMPSVSWRNGAPVTVQPSRS